MSVRAYGFRCSSHPLSRTLSEVRLRQQMEEGKEEKGGKEGRKGGKGGKEGAELQLTAAVSPFTCARAED